VSRTRPGYNILYVKSEDFTNELISAVRTNSTASFRENIVRLMFCSWMTFSSWRERINQEEFFHTFNTFNWPKANCLDQRTVRPKKSKR
jgi:chromosomal replication initiator protein